MRRSLPTALVVVVGLVLLLDFVVVNPSLAALSGALLELIVLLAAAAAITGGLALAIRHVVDVRHGRLLPAGARLVARGEIGSPRRRGFSVSLRRTE